MKLSTRYIWKELVDGSLLDPERHVTDFYKLYTYPTKQEALAALSQFLHLEEWNGREFILLEVVGLD